jgi:DNA polymerase-3 subunit gamma/tau
VPGGARTATDESWPDAPDDHNPGSPPDPDPTQTSARTRSSRGAGGQAGAGAGGLAGAGLAAARSAAAAAAQAGPRAPAPRQGGSAAWPSAIPARDKGTESDEVDPLNDADADVDAVSGMALLERELGASVIGEIDHT